MSARKQFLLFLLFVVMQLGCMLSVSLAGTVDSATLSPASATIQKDAVLAMDFSAMNDKTFDIKTFSAVFSYTPGLNITNLATTPPAAKAIVNSSKNIITLQWSGVSKGATLAAIFDVSSSTVGVYDLLPSTITYTDSRNKTYSGSCNSSHITVQGSTTGTVSGTVSDASTGTPLKDVAVTILDSGQNTFTQTTPRDTGSYTVLDVLQGDFTATFRKKGYLDFMTRGLLAGGEELVLNVLLEPESGSYETIKPTDAFNPGGWSSPFNGFDADVNTFTSINSANAVPSISFGGSASDERINAWQSKSQYWNSAWLYVTFESGPVGTRANDLVELQITDGLGNVKHTILPTTTSTERKGFAQKLEMSDWGDGLNGIANLRVRVNGYRSGSADKTETRVYDVRINGDPSPYVKNYSKGKYTVLPGDDNDLNSYFTPAEIRQVSKDDGERVAQGGSYATGERPVQLFKEKISGGDLAIGWKGQPSNGYDESYAVSFSPASSGRLSSLDFLFHKEGTPTGSVRVLLKDELGGRVIAESSSLQESLLPSLDDWVRFAFSVPAYITAGKTYYAEIWRDRFDINNELVMQHCVCGDRSGFVRYSGEWHDTETTYFHVYINGVTDNYNFGQCEDSIFQRYIYGLDRRPVYLDIYSRTTASWERLDSMVYDGSTSDIALSGIVSIADYIDAEGWVAARVAMEEMGNGSYPGYNLATDSIQFRAPREISVTPVALDFGQVAVLSSAVQQVLVSNVGAGELAIGAIMPLSEPFSISYDGCSGVTLAASSTCSVVVDFSPLSEGVFAGTLTIPYNDDIQQASVSLQGSGTPQLATLTGVITDSATGLPLPGVQVAVTDGGGSHNAATDSGGRYLIEGVLQGAFTAVFSKSGYIAYSGSGSVSAGQTITLDVRLSPIPPLTLTITSPQDGIVVNVSSVTVTGDVSNNAQVTVNGVQASISGNTFSASVSLVEGSNTITAVATDQYGQTMSKSVSVTMVPSPLISGISAGNITADSVTITWTTDQPSDSLVQYGTTTSYGSSANDTALLTTHSITLTNLTPGTTYHFIVRSANSYGFSSSSADNTFTTSVPNPPVISNIIATDITANSALVRWITDQPSDNLVEYGETTAYGNVFADSTVTTSHSIVLTNLNPNTTYHFKVTSMNNYGSFSSSGDNTFTTAGVILITISSPLAGEMIARPDITVKGTMANTLSNETGVTVSGIIATVYGDQFIANHVPLTEGPNTITVTATDTEGNTAANSITVNATAPANYIRLTSNIESGISPLEVTLRIDGSFSIDSSNMNVTGPAAIELLENPTPDEYRIKMTAEGIYYFTANVTGPDAVTYQDTVAVTVLNKEQLDALLKSKWEGMKTDLISGDLLRALSYFSEDTQQLYSDIFTALGPQLPQIVQQMQGIQLIYVEGNAAKYRIRRTEQYGGQTLDITYYIYFTVDKEGTWKIYRY